MVSLIGAAEKRRGKDILQNLIALEKRSYRCCIDIHCRSGIYSANHSRFKKRDEHKKATFA